MHVREVLSFFAAVLSFRHFCLMKILATFRNSFETVFFTFPCLPIHSPCVHKWNYSAMSNFHVAVIFNCYITSFPQKLLIVDDRKLYLRLKRSYFDIYQRLKMIQQLNKVNGEHWFGNY